jgi:hypothetical protein
VYEEESGNGNVLKNVVPMISRDPAGYHPIGHTAWYEYAKGMHEALHYGFDEELTR